MKLTRLCGPISLIVVLVAFGTRASNAQVATGTPAFGSFAGSPDVINLGNLNAHIVIPIISKAGRGIPFTYQLTYDTSVWYPVGASGSQFWTPVTLTNWGWQGQTAVATGYVEYNSFPGSCISGGRQVPYTIYNFVAYHDAFGVNHYFNLVADNLTGHSRCGGPFSASGTAQDGSGYTMNVTGGPSATLIPPRGGSIVPPLGTTSGAATITDPNGNEITTSGSSFTDTLGTTALSLAGSGTPSSPITLTYTAPSGANAVYTEKFASYTVETNFGCSGISEFGPTTESLVSEIDLPDIGAVPNDKYTITYEATPGHSGNVTGRIASITFPTGGTISYSYSGGSNGITCADGSVATLTRTTPDGTWKYAHALVSGTQWSTTITDPTPQANQTVLQFQEASNNFYQTEEQDYTGSSTLLRTVYTCYSGAPPCNTVAVSPPITYKEVFVQWPSGQESEVLTTYNSYGLYTGEDDLDYGNGKVGNLLRQTLVTYASLGNGIVSAPAQVTIENASSQIVAQTTYTYDQGSVVALSGTPQLASVSGSRGNPTTISYMVSGSTSLSKTFTYYNTGNVDTATDVNGSQSTVTYNYSNATATCGNAFPSSVSEPLSLSKSMTWNCTGGVNASVTDENNQTASTAYSDAYFWRPASTTDQESNQTTFYYQPNASYPTGYAVVPSMTFNGGNSITSDYHYMDGLGRTYVDQHIESPSSSTLDSVSYAYDSVGRLASTSGPCAIGWAGTCSGPTTTQTYDALSRPVLTTDGGGGTVTLSYTGNDILQTVGPAPTGENTKRRQSEYNGMGQLTSVCEVTSLSGSGTCGQTTSATGYWTEYTYDVLGDLLNVTQNAQSSSTESRTYFYDALGRMTSEANPEMGNVAVYYFYDSDPGTKGGANCSGTYDGDLVKRVDAAGNVTCYTYDALHRPLSVTYPYGTNSGNTPGKFFVYDSATVDGNAMGNAKSRLAEAYTATCSTCSKITDEGFNYTVRGEVATVYESTPHSSGYFWVTQSYWANGAPNSQNNNLSAIPAITNGVDGEGRVNTVSAQSGQNPVTSTSYNPASEVTALTLGSSDSDAFTFDSNTFRITQYQFNVNGKSVTGALSWNANWSLGQLAITDAFNSTNTQTCNYSHDDLARIASANCGSSMSQTFTYDAFGNLTKNGTFSFQPGYNNKNHMNSGATYDLNGDVLTDSLHSYAWDVETRPTTIDTVTATYDALGRMVEQTKSGTSTEIVYDCMGNKLALMNTASTLVKAFVPLPGGGTAVYAPGGLQYYRHPDWLAASRFSSTPSRTMYNDLAYAPFGEQYAQSGSTGVTDTSFAWNNEDTTTNLYDARFREYEIYGRWPSPDPAGFSAANPANPQSWNRYVYALNSPLLLIDPSGLHWEKACTHSAAGDNCSWVWYDDPFPASFAMSLLGGNPQGGLGGLGGGPGPGGGNGGPGSPQLPCVNANFIDKLEIPILQKIASANNETVGIGLTFSAGAGNGVGTAGGVSAFLVVTPGGQAGFVKTVGATPILGPVAGAGVFGGPAFLQSSATTLSQLGGFGVDFGASAAQGFGVSTDVAVGNGGVATTVSSVGFGLGGNGHAVVIQSSSIIPVCPKKNL